MIGLIGDERLSQAIANALKERGIIPKILDSKELDHFTPKEPILVITEAHESAEKYVREGLKLVSWKGGALVLVTCQEEKSNSIQLLRRAGSPYTVFRCDGILSFSHLDKKRRVFIPTTAQAPAQPTLKTLANQVANAIANKQIGEGKTIKVLPHPQGILGALEEEGFKVVSLPRFLFRLASRLGFQSFELSQ